MEKTQRPVGHYTSRMEETGSALRALAVSAEVPGIRVTARVTVLPGNLIL